MENQETQIVEINGVKLEVDMRYAKRVDNFRVGSKCKLLDKSSYGGQSVFSGVVVGFEPFESMPTIIVAYVTASYSDADVKFAYINSSDKSREKWELIATVDDELPISKADVMANFTAKRTKLKEELEELNRKEDYFLRHFNQYFPDLAEV